MTQARLQEFMEWTDIDLLNRTTFQRNGRFEVFVDDETPSRPRVIMMTPDGVNMDMSTDDDVDESIARALFVARACNAAMDSLLK